MKNHQKNCIFKNGNKQKMFEVKTLSEGLWLGITKKKEEMTI